jgi:hypothetical protein
MEGSAAQCTEEGLEGVVRISVCEAVC